jgi:ATP-dependent DNA helicase RecQ
MSCKGLVKEKSSAHGAIELLKRYFGYSNFHPMQEGIINDILAGRDVFVLMPTGSGKSLCYQLPAIMKDGVAVVVSPLIALMKDQVDSLRANGIGATFINSTLGPEEIETRKRRLARGEDKILYIAPERLASHDFMPFLTTLKVSLFAIDEAHCISEWGHDFRPDYRNLMQLRETFPDVPIVALTATAVPDVQKDIVQQLRLVRPKIYRASFNRPNLSYHVRPKDGAYTHLVDYLRRRPKDSGIIYCLSRRATERLAEKLRDDGFRALPYHAGMLPAIRVQNQERFIRDDVELIVATIAFGMGVNKPNIRYVIHYDLPKNIESYYQETGRAGRDSLESDCILFFSYGDRMKIEAFIDKMELPEKRRAAYGKLDDMIKFCESAQCRRKVLLGYFGEDYEGPCNRCDNCLRPREAFDGTEVAKKITTCILQTGQSFGAGYISSLLSGKKSKKARMYNHHALKIFGSGKEWPSAQWQAFIRELVNKGYLDVVGDKYPILKLNKKSQHILSGKGGVMLTRAMTEVLEMPDNETAIDVTLFNILRALRKSIADSERVPPYMIFHDTALKELATRRPHDMAGLKKIHGMGQVKLEKYGKAFLEKVTEYCKAHNS